jgi:uncharacterized protein YyaL (SSP411 family)
MPNRLIRETSPYLLQHAHNPVDWYPWSDEALSRARDEDKPILLSIGYSACHWCHVMEHESFENAAIARLMNDNFVNIKVDREERPDLDQIYMGAVQLMTGSGGWPLTVFLLPGGEPFYGGTYFPPDDRYGRPGFPRLLVNIAEAYRNRRQDVQDNAKRLREHLNQQIQSGQSTGELNETILDNAARSLESRFDLREGGFGGAPKFPPSMTIDFLLRYHHRTGSARALEMATLTLDKMAYGGMYDQIGGGFHRYSTDDRWLVPHFEKMLYDNALLARAYLDAYRLTGRPLYRRITEEVLDFIVREMRDPNGGFYSTQDADSEGVEGKFYVWDRSEFEEVIGDDGELLARYFNVTDHGNWEHHNILNVPRPPELFCKAERIAEAELSSKIAAATPRLYAAREKRVRPGRDEKILADWNGLALRAFAEAAAFLGREDYRKIAEENAAFVFDKLWDGQRLVHSFKDGRARFNAYLDDYANVADGLLALYQLTFEEQWLRRSELLAEIIVDRFADKEQGGFYFTARDHEELIARTKDLFDNATPSGNSVAADVLLRLAAVLGHDNFRNIAERTLAAVENHLGPYASGFGRMLAALDFAIGPVAEIALVGDNGDFLSAYRKLYLPRAVIASGGADIALLRGRQAVDGKPTAYICENLACRQPVTDVREFEKQLGEFRGQTTRTPNSHSANLGFE